MTLSYSQWTPAEETSAPEPVFGFGAASRPFHLPRSISDRWLALGVSLAFQLFVALLVLSASFVAIRKPPPVQTIEISISAPIKPETPVDLPKFERLPDMSLPQIAPPQIEIAAPPTTMAIQSVPPAPPTPPQQQKPAEEVPFSPPRFDAAYLNNPQPAYPNMSRRLRETGIVQLRVRVSTAGLPLEVQMNKSSGYARLDEAAMTAVKKYKFQPAMRSGSAVEAWVLVPFDFTLGG